MDAVAHSMSQIGHCCIHAFENAGAARIVGLQWVQWVEHSSKFKLSMVMEKNVYREREVYMRVCYLLKITNTSQRWND